MGVRCTRGRADTWRRPQRDQLERPAPVGVAVALLVGAVERLGDVAAERDGQLERLAGVADVGLAVGGQLGAVPAARPASAPCRAARR